MKKISLKKAIEIFGGVNIKLSRNYCEQSGFFEKDGQLYYINSGDVRMRRPDGVVVYRTTSQRLAWWYQSVGLCQQTQLRLYCWLQLQMVANN